MRGGHAYWGFGSANHSVAADGEWVYAWNLDGHLIRFRWTPGGFDSRIQVDQLELGRTGALVRRIRPCAHNMSTT